MLVELHLLTPHAPSNLNRDDFGRPKTALFGGTERGRISSQALKRAIRKSGFVADRLGGKISTRSLHIPQLIYDAVKSRWKDEDINDAQLARLGVVCEAVAHGLGKPEKANKEDEYSLKTSQIVFLTKKEIAHLTDFVVRTVESDTKLTNAEIKKLGEKVAIESGLNTRPSDGVDVALFGRMTTDKSNSFKGVDAAMQVAHPIATHTTTTETDYFTAVDDWNVDTGERGSGHIGELDFNSAVYYKYFSCNFSLLKENLGNDASAALEALEVFLEAACRVSPSGKQNSFASHSPADAALLIVRSSKMPCSLAAAFERPVPATEEGYSKASLGRMLTRYARLVTAYEFDDKAIAFALEEELPDGPYGRADKLSQLWKFLRDVLGEDGDGQE